MVICIIPSSHNICHGLLLLLLFFLPPLLFLRCLSAAVIHAAASLPPSGSLSLVSFSFLNPLLNRSKTATNPFIGHRIFLTATCTATHQTILFLWDSYVIITALSCIYFLQGMRDVFCTECKCLNVVSACGFCRQYRITAFD